MADFVGLLRKTIEAQPQATARLRQRIYERARATVQRKLEESRASAQLIALQQAVLQQAVDEVEAYYRALEADEMVETIPPDQSEPAPPVPASTPPASSIEAPLDEGNKQQGTLPQTSAFPESNFGQSHKSDEEGAATSPQMGDATRSSADFVPFDSSAFRRVRRVEDEDVVSLPVEQNLRETLKIEPKEEKIRHGIPTLASLLRAGQDEVEHKNFPHEQKENTAGKGDISNASWSQGLDSSPRILAQELVVSASHGADLPPSLVALDEVDAASFDKKSEQREVVVPEAEPVAWVREDKDNGSRSPATPSLDDDPAVPAFLAVISEPLEHGLPTDASFAEPAASRPKGTVLSPPATVEPERAEEMIFPLPASDQEGGLVPQQDAATISSFSLSPVLSPHEEEERASSSSPLPPEGELPWIKSAPFFTDQEQQNAGDVLETGEVMEMFPAIPSLGTTADQEAMPDFESTSGLGVRSGMGEESSLAPFPFSQATLAAELPEMASGRVVSAEGGVNERGGDGIKTEPLAVGDFNAVSDIFSSVARRERRKSRIRYLVALLTVCVLALLIGVGVWLLMTVPPGPDDEQVISEHPSDSGGQTGEGVDLTPKMTQRLLPGGRESDPGPTVESRSFGQETGQGAMSSSLGRQARVVYIEAASPSSPVVIHEGRVEWTLSRTPSEFGGLDELGIVGTIDIPEEEMTVRLSIQRNTDVTIDAAYLFYFTFVTSRDPGGETVDAIRLLFKASEQSEGQGLIGAIPVKVRENFFVLALRGSRQALEHNLALMRQLPFLRLNIVYANNESADFSAENAETEEGMGQTSEMLSARDETNRRDQNFRIGEFSIAKGTYGDSLFKQAIDDWLVKANWAPLTTIPSAPLSPSVPSLDDAQPSADAPVSNSLLVDEQNSLSSEQVVPSPPANGTQTLETVSGQESQLETTGQ